MSPPAQHLPRNWIESRTPQQQAKLRNLTDVEADTLLYDWFRWARTEQWPPEGSWQTWLYLAGRGAGKTRSGAEWVRGRIKAGARRVA